MGNTNTMQMQYLCNPDVVLREEDESGALLFNPDTNQVKVLNATGLFIWKQFQSENCSKTVIKEMLEEFEDVPEVQVSDHFFVYILLQSIRLEDNTEAINC